MNRRNFLTCLALTPILTSELMASDDVFLSSDEYSTLVSLDRRLRRLQSYVGYANFNIISFPQALYFGRNYSKIGAFTKKELSLIDKLFYETPHEYGFYGNKTCTDINNAISAKEIIKMPHTGHFLFKDKSLADYNRLLKDIGDSIKLTSGVRNVVKQLSLYVHKIHRCNGNMTLATNSIAPPAYSYHTISDFDVGKVDWGYKNFTPAFATTYEFNKMTKLSYIGMRYTHNNKDGVRFEPWHVEVK